jgi:hypothetical protein
LNPTAPHPFRVVRLCYGSLVPEGLMQKPADLVLGVEDRPPLADGILVAAQHIGAIAVNFV